MARHALRVGRARSGRYAHAPLLEWLRWRSRSGRTQEADPGPRPPVPEPLRPQSGEGLDRERPARGMEPRLQGGRGARPHVRRNEAQLRLVGAAIWNHARARAARAGTRGPQVHGALREARRPSGSGRLLDGFPTTSPRNDWCLSRRTPAQVCSSRQTGGWAWNPRLEAKESRRSSGAADSAGALELASPPQTRRESRQQRPLALGPCCQPVEHERPRTRDLHLVGFDVLIAGVQSNQPLPLHRSSTRPLMIAAVSNRRRAANRRREGPSRFRVRAHRPDPPWRSSLPQSTQKVFRSRRDLACFSSGHPVARMFLFTATPQFGQKRIVTMVRP